MKHVVIPKAQHSEIILRQPVIAFNISNGIGVLATVNFDDHSHFEANKIRDIWPHRNLPTKFERGKPPVFECKRKLALGIGHAHAQLAG